MMMEPQVPALVILMALSVGAGAGADTCTGPTDTVISSLESHMSSDGTDTERLSEQECWSYGLISSGLACSICDELSLFYLTDLKPICLKCCTQRPVAEKEVRYHRAVLEVCTCKFGAYPQIKAFVESTRPAKYPNLQIRYVRGLDPIIKMMDKDGNIRETVAIDRWNTDSVDEFLETHLVQPDMPDIETNRI